MRRHTSKWWPKAKAWAGDGNVLRFKLKTGEVKTLRGPTLTELRIFFRLYAEDIETLAVMSQNMDAWV